MRKYQLLYVLLVPLNWGQHHVVPTDYSVSIIGVRPSWSRPWFLWTWFSWPRFRWRMWVGIRRIFPSILLLINISPWMIWTRRWLRPRFFFIFILRIVSLLQRQLPLGHIYPESLCQFYVVFLTVNKKLNPFLINIFSVDIPSEPHNNIVLEMLMSF